MDERVRSLVAEEPVEEVTVADVARDLDEARSVDPVRVRPGDVEAEDAAAALEDHLGHRSAEEPGGARHQDAPPGPSPDRRLGQVHVTHGAEPVAHSERR